MRFDSIEYLALLLATFAAFRLAGARLRPYVLLAASILFYCSWKWPFFLLILASSVLDWLVGRGIAATDDRRRRRLWLAASLTGNLGLLVWFKYADFIRSSLHALWPDLEFLAEPLRITLPVGISFYTFQTLSYSVDVWRGRLPAQRRFLDFLLYVSFFPQLVAGPIERAGHLMPQLETAKGHRLGRDDLGAGIWLIALGLFQKCALADNLARLVDPIFAAPGHAGAADQFAAILAFSFQIFFDFSGYSNIARGSAALFGIRLVRNFRLPYLADGPSDFWRRWHVSLSQWIRDYVYIPLGGARSGVLRTLFNLILTMALAGLWHGAAWHFVAWGLFHGLLLVVWRLFAALGRPPAGGFVGGICTGARVALTFAATLFGWLLFRAADLDDALLVTRDVGAWLAGGATDFLVSPQRRRLTAFVVLAFTVMIAEERLRLTRRLIARPGVWLALVAALSASAWILAPEAAPEFIYFQF